MTDDSIPCEVGPIHMVQRLFKAFEFFMTWKSNFNKNRLFGAAIVRSWLYKQIKYLLRLCFERHVTVNTQLLQTLYHINQPKYKMWYEVSETFIICSDFTFGFVFRFIFRLSVISFSNSASIGMKAWHRHFLDNKPPITAACRLVALECPFEVSSFMDTWTCLGFTGRQIFLVGALPNYRLINFCNW